MNCKLENGLFKLLLCYLVLCVKWINFFLFLFFVSKYTIYNKFFFVVIAFRKYYYLPTKGPPLLFAATAVARFNEYTDFRRWWTNACVWVPFAANSCRTDTPQYTCMHCMRAFWSTRARFSPSSFTLGEQFNRTLLYQTKLENYLFRHFCLFLLTTHSIYFISIALPFDFW